eukprot:416367-Prymnesium_polylepis.1
MNDVRTRGTGAHATQVPQLTTSTARHRAPLARPTRALMLIHARSGALVRHMQTEPARPDQTGPHTGGTMSLIMRNILIVVQLLRPEAEVIVHGAHG